MCFAEQNSLKEVWTFRFFSYYGNKVGFRLSSVVIALKKSTRSLVRVNQSVNLNLKMYQMAATPSFQVIFFPSE